MSAIAGILRRGAPPALDEVRHLTRAQAHRGPDGEAYFVRGPVALGQCRHSVTSPEGQAQPLGTPDGAAWIVCDGSMDNGRELRAELEGAGHAFRTHAHAEVALLAYVQWGPACVERMRGRFAFAVADLRARRLFLARDPVGAKPLVYRRSGDSVVFASEIEALRAVESVTPQGRLEAVEYFLRYGYIPAPHTIYRDVHKLPAGHWAQVPFDGQRIDVRAYWTLAFDGAQTMAPDRALQRTEAAIAEAIEAQVAPHAHFGVLLSGGLGSTVVALAARRVLGRRFPAFTVDYEEAQFSERAWAAEVARRLDLDLCPRTIRAEALDLVPRLVHACGEPFGDRGATPAWLASGFARESVPLVLTGDGADEAFAGLGRHAAWLDASDGPARSRTTRLVRRAADRMRARGRLGRYEAHLSRCDAGLRRALWRPEYAHLVDRACAPFTRADRLARRCDPLGYAQTVDLATHLPGSTLAKTDVASMSHGLDARPVLADVQVLRTAAALPAASRLQRTAGRGWSGKHVLKEILAAHVPAPFLSRAKRGLALDRGRWLHPESRSRRRLETVLCDRAAGLSEWLRPSALQDLLRAHDAGEDASGPLWLLYVLGLWRAMHPEVAFR